MADEIKDLDTEETSAAAGENTAVADATGDDGQQSLDLPATEGEADPKPEAAAGEPSPVGDEASAATDEANPTPMPPADLEDRGTSEALTLAAEGSNEDGTETEADAGAEEAAPEAPSTPDLGAPEAQPNVGVPEADAEPSVSTGIGGDKASEVTPPDAPKLEPEQPTPLPAPSMFNSGTAIRVPDTSIALDDGYPVAQPEAAPVHPCHFGQMQNDGVGDDAGKVVDAPKYPMPADAVLVVKGEGDKADAGSAVAPADEGEKSDEAGVPSAIPPHVEGKLAKLAEKIDAIAGKVDQLLHELLD